MIMKKKLGKLIAFALIFAFAFILSSATLAAADVSVTVEPETMAEGEDVKLTVTVSGKGLSVVTGTFTYDAYMLTFSAGDGGVSDGFINMTSAENGGADTLKAVISFKARRAGEAEVKLTLSSILDYSGKEAGPYETSVKFTVTDAPEAAPGTEEAAKDYSEAAFSVPAVNVEQAPDTMYVWRSLENVTLPSRYVETELTYHNENVTAATVPDSNAPTLLYLSDKTGENDGFYIFDEANDLLYKYKTLSSTSRAYILLKPAADVAVPEGFTAAKIPFGEGEIDGYLGSDAQGDVYLVYARNSSGDVGFFSYSVEDKSLQRYSVTLARPASPSDFAPTSTPLPATSPEASDALTPEESPDSENTKEGVTLSSGAFYALVIGAGVLLIALVALIVLRAADNAKRKRRMAERRAKREQDKGTDIQ